MFSEKKIRVEVQKISGSFTPFSGVYNFVDLPIEVKINKVKLPAGYTATINIYGVSKQTMDSMTLITWQVGLIDQIAVRVFANDGDGEHLLFEGQIMSALPNYSNAPDVCISINACAGAFYNLVTDVPPSSDENGKEVPVRQVFEDICNQYGVNLDNRGVEGTCRYPRIEGDGLLSRITAASKAYNVTAIIENGTVIIFPKGSTLYKSQEWYWTSQDYIGYPSFNITGIDLKLDRAIYNLQLWDFFTLRGSIIPAANDRWAIIKITYNISTKIGGKWEMSVSGIRVGSKK